MKDLVSILHHKVRSAWHEVASGVLATLHHNCRLPFLVWRVADHVTRKAGDLVDFFVQRDSILQVLELHRAADLGENREGIRIPLHQHLSELDMISISNLQLGAVND